MNYTKLFLSGLLLLSVVSEAQPVQRGDATAATAQANTAVAADLPFANSDDFALAERGLVARPSQLVIRDAAGTVVWDMDRFQFSGVDAPATVNPSLWRQAQLNAQYGLYKIAERVYQVRGFDVTNLSIIVGETGYIVVDPL
jgi:alkyl sulfatase BDS1-like metallo-beta-lactamase superfamily hydrolase